MAEFTVYPTIDGRLLKIGNSWADTTWPGVAASTVTTTAEYANSGINAIDLSDYNTTQVERFFLEFDTSGVTTTPSSATVQIYGKQSGTADVIGVGCSDTANGGDGFATAGAIVVGDWDCWFPYDGSYSSETAWTDELSTWTTTGYNTFTVNSYGLAAMVAVDEWQICFLEADNDYPNLSAGSGLSVSSGYYMSNDSAGDDSNDRDPKLVYEIPAPSTTQGKTCTNIKSKNLNIKSAKIDFK
jgi:hypothetical protein